MSSGTKLQLSHKHVSHLTSDRKHHRPKQRSISREEARTDALSREVVLPKVYFADYDQEVTILYNNEPI